MTADHSARGSSTPLVQIGLPVFNGADFLEDALDCLQAQDYVNLEIIISDNGSTDATPEICGARAALDSRVRYERHEENRGATWNFEHVLSRCTADYFAWASADDRWAESFVRRCMELLLANPSAALAHAQVERIDGLGEPYLEPYRGFSATDADPRTRFRNVLRDWRWSFAIYGVIRVGMLRRTRSFRSSYGADHIRLAELSLRGTLLEVPEVLFFHRTMAPTESPSDYAERVRESLDPKGETLRVDVPLVRMGFAHLRTAATSSGGPSRVLLVSDVLTTWWLHAILLDGVARVFVRLLGAERWGRAVSRVRRFGWYRRFRPKS